MIAFDTPGFQKPTVSDETWQERFLKILPIIHCRARFATRNMSAERRDEAIQEIVANACAAFARLVIRGKEEVAHPLALARYAISQFFDGRRVGNKWSVRDVMSESCQRRKGVVVERLDRYDPTNAEWKEAVIDDPRASVFRLAAFRIDFPAWLAKLPKRTRRIALAMARGDTTSEVAKRFNLSAGRISQLRRELHDSWKEFHDGSERLEREMAAA